MEITLQTRAGTIIGLQKETHQEFLGVRYAKAPVGALRFQPPERIDQWDDVYDATSYGPVAPQAHDDDNPFRLEKSEDCLHLNIFTPDKDGKKKPVMVFIHGGGFLIDTCSRPRTHGGNLAAFGDVVVVMMEYRMGAFGFLYTDNISPNLGLQDQVCALEWVQRNISDYGGDPENVTIFGQSAGGTSVAYLMVMPSARGLFHKAIQQSGTTPLESQEENRKFAKNGTVKFFRQLKLQPGDLEGLQAIPMDKILKAQKKAAGVMLLLNDRAFYPVVDGKIIPENIHDVLKRKGQSNIPLMLGYNAEELPFLGGAVKNKIVEFVLKHLLLRAVRKLGISRQQVKSLLEIYRTELPKQSVAEDREINHLASDMNFLIPLTRTAENFLTGGGKVYFYCLAYPAPGCNAALHVEDLFFVFGSVGTEDAPEYMRVPDNDQTQQLSEKMMEAWTNFAKNGDPNTDQLPDWPVFDPLKRPVMEFNIESQVVNGKSDKIRAAWKDALNV